MGSYVIFSPSHYARQFGVSCRQNETLPLAFCKGVNLRYMSSLLILYLDSLETQICNVASHFPFYVNVIMSFDFVWIINPMWILNLLFLFGKYRHHHLRYTNTPGDEVEDMFVFVKWSETPNSFCCSCIIWCDRIWLSKAASGECVLKVRASFFGIFMETRPISTPPRNGKLC